MFERLVHACRAAPAPFRGRCRVAAAAKLGGLSAGVGREKARWSPWSLSEGRRARRCDGGNCGI